jgi:glycerol-3-phosphate acyltransferase PlsX
VGANLEVRASHLEQFAVMGACFHRAVVGGAEPRVALLSIGEEEVKGNELIRTVHRHLKEGPVHFIGNVDGKDVFSGHADVIVTDGFTGNAIIKSGESLLKALVGVLREEMGESWPARIGYLFLRGVVTRLKLRLDHSEYGAVPLLGVDRPVFIGHGSSSAKSIRSAIRVAATFVKRRVNDTIEEQLRALAATHRGDEGEAAGAAAGGRGGPRASGGET